MQFLFYWLCQIFNVKIYRHGFPAFLLFLIFVSKLYSGFQNFSAPWWTSCPLNDHFHKSPWWGTPKCAMGRNYSGIQFFRPPQLWGLIPVFNFQKNFKKVHCHGLYFRDAISKIKVTLKFSPKYTNMKDHFPGELGERQT